MRIAIVCYSLTGHTSEMAGEIALGIEDEGVEARIFNIRTDEVDAEYISSASGLIIGTPTYMASSVWQVKKWIEEDSRPLALSGKLGGAFATAHYAQGGQDTAIMDILGQLLVKGMLLYSGGGCGAIDREEASNRDQQNIEIPELIAIGRIASKVPQMRNLCASIAYYVYLIAPAKASLLVIMEGMDRLDREWRC